jgi:hypothetical protein
VFDFRYHALTLVAVFVALMIGLLLGVAIGDSGLVSGAERDLRQSLRGDVRDAQAQVKGLRSELAARQRYEEQTLPSLVSGRLDNRRIALVFIGGREDAVFRGVQEAIAPSGGELSFVTTLRSPLDLSAIAGLAAGTRYERVMDDPTLLDELGRRIGRQLIRGGRLIADLRPELLSSSNGELQPFEGVVIARSPAADRQKGGAAALSKRFVDGLLAGIRDARAPVVGVETIATDPSQVRWYIDHGLATIDDTDRIAGRASLVFALAGEADGHYGEKATADALLPDALTRTPGTP